MIVRVKNDCIFFLSTKIFCVKIVHIQYYARGTRGVSKSRAFAILLRNAGIDGVSNLFFFPTFTLIYKISEIETEAWLLLFADRYKQIHTYFDNGNGSKCCELWEHNYNAVFRILLIFEGLVKVEPANDKK